MYNFKVGDRVRVQKPCHDTKFSPAWVEGMDVYSGKEHTIARIDAQHWRQVESAKSMIHTLDPKEARVVTARYFEGLTLKQIGSELGVTAQRVEQISKTALTKLKKGLI